MLFHRGFNHLSGSIQAQHVRHQLPLWGIPYDKPKYQILLIFHYRLDPNCLFSLVLDCCQMIPKKNVDHISILGKANYNSLKSYPLIQSWSSRVGNPAMAHEAFPAVFRRRWPWFMTCWPCKADPSGSSLGMKVHHFFPLVMTSEVERSTIFFNGKIMENPLFRLGHGFNS